MVTEVKQGKSKEQWCVILKSVKVQHKVIYTSLYDKKDALSFDIVNFPTFQAISQRRHHVVYLFPKFSDTLMHVWIIAMLVAVKLLS